MVVSFLKVAEQFNQRHVMSQEREKKTEERQKAKRGGSEQPALHPFPLVE